MTRKFIDTVEIDEWEIETDSGWSDIKAIGKTVQYEVFYMQTQSGFDIRCADDHIVFNDKLEEVFVKDLHIGDFVITDNGSEKVTNIKNMGYFENMYDLQLNDENHRYYTNGILSHNSIWCSNLAVNLANSGKNVLIVTLEMSEQKYLKRVASNLYSIPLSNYDETIKDKSLVESHIKKYNKKHAQTDGMDIMASKSPGKLIIKEFPTSSLKVTELDSYIKKTTETTKIKFDVIVLDYLNLMVDSKNPNSENTYLKVKSIAEQLRAMATTQEIAVITATQSNRGGLDKQGGLMMSDVSESIGLPQTVDALFSINKDFLDKENSTFTLGAAALRDAEGMGETQTFFIDSSYLRITQTPSDYICTDTPGRGQTNNTIPKTLDFNTPMKAVPSVVPTVVPSAPASGALQVTNRAFSTEKSMFNL